MENAIARTILNILIIASATTAIIFDFFNNTVLYSIFKPLTTVLILSLLFFVQNIQQSRFKNTIIAALVLCLVGDVFLLYEAYFVFGLGSFLMGHLLFASGFIRLGGFSTNWISLLILLTIGGTLFFWLRPNLGAFELPVGIYIIVIVFMAWQGMELFFRNRQTAHALIGIAVLLFMFSDTMIAINKFKSPFTLSGPIILSTYWLSVSLIANATYSILDKKSK